MTQRAESMRVVVATNGPWGVDAVVALLERESYRARLCALDERLMELVDEWRPELAVVGWSNRGTGVLPLFRRLRRRSGMPILVVVDSMDEVDVVAAYEAGVDSVIPQAVGPDELLARIRALRRRTRGRRRPSGEPRSDGFALDVRSRVLVTATCTYTLSDDECLLLTLLLEAEGHLVARTTLARAIWGRPPERCRKSLDAHVRRLREKIEIDPARPITLLTVRGVGFLLERHAGALVVRDDADLDLTEPVAPPIDLVTIERFADVRASFREQQLSTPTVPA